MIAGAERILMLGPRKKGPPFKFSVSKKTVKKSKNVLDKEGDFFE